MTIYIIKSPSAAEQSRSCWPKKNLIKIFFVMALIWGVLTILLFLQSNLVVNNSDNFLSDKSSSSSLTDIPRNEIQHHNEKKRRYLPRLIYLGTMDELIEHTHHMQQQTQQREIYVEEDSLTKHSYIANDANYKQVDFQEKMFDEECVAMGSWQESSFPNCNQIHEMGLLDKVTTDEFKYVASGGWNDVFRILDTTSGLDDPAMAMKKLSPKRGNPVGLVDKYKIRNYDRVRQDAIILERLSSSNHVMDIVGYCGVVIIGPFADGGTLESKHFASLKKKASNERLKLMVDAAKGLAAIHGDDIPSIVHGDLTMKQYMFVNGMLQLGDFNQAILIKRNSTSPDTACTFHRIDPDYGVFRSPEEYSHKPQTTAVDVWALGSIIYHALTGKQVWKDQYKKRDAEKAMIRGELPLIDDVIVNSSDPVDQALLKAFYMCYTYDPQKRPSAKEVASYLEERWLELSKSTKGEYNRQ
jgi:serine/threonine protein kinase